LQVGENDALSLVEGLEKIFIKLSIEEKTKQTKITEMLAINKQSDENITVKLFKVIVPRSIKLIFINNKELIPKKLPFFLDSSLGIPYIVLWFNVCNKELLALRNNFRVTKKFLIAKFDCSRIDIVCIIM